jgi:hypothetical protein
MAHMNHHLGRVRPRDEVGRAKQVEEVSLGEPLAAIDDFIMQHSNVCCWSAEGRKTQTQR